MPVEKRYVPKKEFLEYLNTFKEEQGREVVIGVVEDWGERPDGDRPGDPERARPSRRRGERAAYHKAG